MPSKQVSLFGDDDESDDDIFGGGRVKKKPASMTKPKEPGNIKVLEISKHSTDVLEVTKQTQPKESSVTKTVPKSSLFDDISDDDDNLFGPSPISNNESVKKSTTIKSATVSKSANLFGDDSSDDDLFGSKPKGRTPIVNLVLQTICAIIILINFMILSKKMLIFFQYKSHISETTPAIVKVLKNRNPNNIGADVRDLLAVLLK